VRRGRPSIAVDRKVVGRAGATAGRGRGGVDMAAGRRADEPRSAGSWWLAAPREGFTDTCRTHEERMRERGVRYYADLSDEVKKRRSL
jgi:hypothetical protein